MKCAICAHHHKDAACSICGCDPATAPSEPSPEELTTEVRPRRYRGDFEPCWIVWQAATDGGRPYLLAVDTSEERAAVHVRAKREEAKLLDQPPPLLDVEESWLDHLYGESMTKSFDETKKIFRGVLSARNAELEKCLARAIEIGLESGSDEHRRQLLALTEILPSNLRPQGDRR